MVVAPSPVFAAEFLVGAVASLALLRLLAEGLRRAIQAMPRPKSPLVRLAFANLVRPGAATGGVVTALGLGLTLLATVTLLNATINAQVAGALPARAPSFFFVDIQPGEAAAFDRTITGFSSASDYKRTPMIRGRITALNGVPSAEAKVAPDAKWALNGDRGITYAATPPPGTIITEGKWWPADYQRPHPDLAGPGHRQGHRPEDRRQHDPECAGPQLRGPHRQSCARWTSPPAGRISCWCCRPG